MSAIGVLCALPKLKFFRSARRTWGVVVDQGVRPGTNDYQVFIGWTVSGRFGIFGAFLRCSDPPCASERSSCLAPGIEHDTSKLLSSSSRRPDTGSGFSRFCRATAASVAGLFTGSGSPRDRRFGRSGRLENRSRHSAAWRKCGRRRGRGRTRPRGELAARGKSRRRRFHADPQGGRLDGGNRLS